MSSTEINEIKRIFQTRLDALSHILDVAEAHRPDMDATLQERLAPDMFTLGAQIALACNQPRGFSQWCAGLPIENLSKDVMTLAQARSHIEQTKALVAGIQATDTKLNEIKRIGMGSGRYCELPARQYVNDYLMPNCYFHITVTYAILRKLGVPLGKADFMHFLAPHVKLEAGA